MDAPGSRGAAVPSLSRELWHEDREQGFGCRLLLERQFGCRDAARRFSLAGLRSFPDRADVLAHYLSDLRGLAALAEQPPRPTIPIKPEFIAVLEGNANVKTLVASHLGPTVDDPIARQEIEARIGRLFVGKFIWDPDGASMTAGESPLK